MKKIAIGIYDKDHKLVFNILNPLDNTPVNEVIAENLCVLFEKGASHVLRPGDNYAWDYLDIGGKV